jgi:hypothetical protein
MMLAARSSSRRRNTGLSASHEVVLVEAKLAPPRIRPQAIERPRVTRALARLDVPGASIESAIDELMNSVVSLDQDLVLVLDDLHTVTDSGCLASIDYGLEGLPLTWSRMPGDRPRRPQGDRRRWLRRVLHSPSGTRNRDHDTRAAVRDRGRGPSDQARDVLLDRAWDLPTRPLRGSYRGHRRRHRGRRPTLEQHQP